MCTILIEIGIAASTNEANMLLWNTLLWNNIYFGRSRLIPVELHDVSLLLIVL